MYFYYYMLTRAPAVSSLQRLKQHVLRAVVLSWNVTVARKIIEGIVGWLDTPGNSSDYQIITTTFSHLFRLDQKQAHLKKISKTTPSSETHYQWFSKRFSFLRPSQPSNTLLNTSFSSSSCTNGSRTLAALPPRRGSAAMAPWFQAYAWCKRNSPIIARDNWWRNPWRNF